eukprot:10335507-Heterocapsa_arctica.AAC.1
MPRRSRPRGSRPRRPKQLRALGWASATWQQRTLPSSPTLLRPYSRPTRATRIGWGQLPAWQPQWPS